MSKRIWFGVQQAGVAVDGSQTFTPFHGLQQFGVSTNFNLTPVLEMGQSTVYDIIEQLPDVEVNLEKDLDSYPLLYHLMTQGSPNGTLIGRSSQKAIIGATVFTDTQLSASGAPTAEVQMSGQYVASMQYAFPTEGPITETVRSVGNNKTIKDMSLGQTAVFSGAFPNNNDSPPSGHVLTRWDVVTTPASGSPAGTDANGATNAWTLVVPTDLYGVTSSGTLPVAADGTLTVPIQSMQFSVDYNRQTVYEQGRRSPYCRYASFPVEVQSTFEVLGVKDDNVQATEAGAVAPGRDTNFQTIRVVLTDGTRFELGTRNRLRSVAQSGGDAGGNGSNVTYQYSYVNWDDFYVYSPADPSGL
jgi:hypothetical protein